MLTRNLVVSTYLQYVLIAFGALLVFTFVQRIGGVLLTFIASASRYLRGTLLFERRHEAPVFPAPLEKGER